LVEEIIPAEYVEFRDMFEELQGEDALLKHQPWDHEIKLQEGKEPPF
jgi:hypothetical protein